MILMQQIFSTQTTPEEYEKQGINYSFPKAPSRCPQPDCKMPIKLKKHGFYSRHYIKAGFCKKILIRRYLCPYCGKTISFLPHFCIPHFQYCGELIVRYIYSTIARDSPLNICLAILRKVFIDICIERQHVYYYNKRVCKNLVHIQHGLRQIYPNVSLPSGDLEKRKKAIEIFDIIEERYTSIHIFNENFFTQVQKSFLAPCINNFSINNEKNEAFFI